MGTEDVGRLEEITDTMKKTILALMVSANFAHAQTLPVRIPMESDTLVGITQHDYDVILFGFAYIKHLETVNNIASEQLSRMDSVNAYLNAQLSLERKKTAQKDTIIANYEAMQKATEKELKRKKRESVAWKIGLPILGAAIIAERLYRELGGYR